MLLAKFYEVVNVNPTQWVLRVLCRYPIVGSAGQILHRLVPLMDDDGVEAMFDIVDNLNRNHCDLYLEVEPIDPSTVGGEARSPIEDALTENLVDSYNEVMPSTSYNSLEHHAAAPPQPSSDPIREYVQHMDMSWDYVADQADEFNGAGCPIYEEETELQEYDILEGIITEDPTTNEHQEAAFRRMHEPMSELFTSVEVDDSAPNWASSLRHRTWNPETEDPCIGQIFKDKDQLVQSMKLYAIKTNQPYITIESNKKSWVVECPKRKEGQCKWRVRASKLVSHGLFEITKYEGPHTCIYARLSQDHDQLDSKFLSGTIIHLVKSNPACSIIGLQAELKERFKYNASYRKT